MLLKVIKMCDSIFFLLSQKKKPFADIQGILVGKKIHRNKNLHYRKNTYLIVGSLFLQGSFDQLNEKMLIDVIKRI